MNKLLNRVLVVLLLPVLVFVFAVGWVLYCVGKHQSNAKAMPPKRLSQFKKEQNSSEDDNVEVGLIEDLMEKQLTTQ